MNLMLIDVGDGDTYDKGRACCRLLHWQLRRARRGRRREGRRRQGWSLRSDGSARLSGWSLPGWQGEKRFVPFYEHFYNPPHGCLCVLRCIAVDAPIQNQLQIAMVTRRDSVSREESRNMPPGRCRCRSGRRYRRDGGRGGSGHQRRPRGVGHGQCSRGSCSPGSAVRERCHCVLKIIEIEPENNLLFRHHFRSCLYVILS